MSQQFTAEQLSQIASAVAQMLSAQGTGQPAPIDPAPAPVNPAPVNTLAPADASDPSTWSVESIMVTPYRVTGSIDPNCTLENLARTDLMCFRKSDSAGEREGIHTYNVSGSALLHTVNETGDPFRAQMIGIAEQLHSSGYSNRPDIDPKISWDIANMRPVDTVRLALLTRLAQIQNSVNAPALAPKPAPKPAPVRTALILPGQTAPSSDRPAALPTAPRIGDPAAPVNRAPVPNLAPALSLNTAPKPAPKPAPGLALPNRAPALAQSFTVPEFRPAVPKLAPAPEQSAVEASAQGHMTLFDPEWVDYFARATEAHLIDREANAGTAPSAKIARSQITKNHRNWLKAHGTCIECAMFTKNRCAFAKQYSLPNLFGFAGDPFDPFA